MTKSEQIEAYFRKDLKEFLDKHRASIDLDCRSADGFETYDVIEVSIDAKYDKNNLQISPSVYFDL